MSSKGTLIRVLITDPHPVVLAGIRTYMQSDPRILVVGECKELWQIVQQRDILSPDMILIGHRLDENGWRTLARARPGVGKFRMLLMSGERGAEAVQPALRAGCRGIYYKSDPLEELSQAIRAVDEGRMWFRDSETHHLVAALGDGEHRMAPRGTVCRGLTERQEQIVSLVARGLTNAEIAEGIRVSQATVALDLTHIYKKLGVPDRVRLLIKVRELNSSDPSWAVAPALPTTAAIAFGRAS